MTELVAYEAPNQLARTDSWVGVLGDVGDLATKIAGTEFVPDAMRGKPAAVAAAILTGRELGVPPMTALAHIHIVKGKPGMSAQLMRQLILGAGHELRYVETTYTRCIVEGRRRGQEDWVRVSFTADQAKAARIDLGGYPEDKLVARATSRLARRVFADVLGGLPYLPEEAAEAAADYDPAPSATPTAARPPAPRRTAQRRTRPAPVEPEAPALDEPQAQADPEPSTPVEMASAAQMTAMAASMASLGYRSRQEQHDLASRMLGRDISSAKDITAQEAHSMLDDFTQAQSSDDPQAYLDELLGVFPAELADDDGVVVEDPPL